MSGSLPPRNGKAGLLDRLRTVVLWEGIAVSAAVGALCTHLAEGGRTGLCAILAVPALALACASLAGLAKRPRP